MMMKNIKVEDLLNPIKRLESETKNFKQQYDRLTNHSDESLVYDFCKSIARILIVFDVGFGDWSFDKKFDLVDSFLNFVDPEMVREGVLTFHENCDHYKL